MSDVDGRAVALREIRSEQTAVTLAYLAGLFDGEGCVSTTAHNRSGKRYETHTLVFSQNERHMCDLFVRVLGVGYVYKTGRRAHQWRANNADAAVAAKALLPYLRLKKAKAETLVQSFARGPEARAVAALLYSFSFDRTKPYSAVWQTDFGPMRVEYTP
jgi:hypothetical protein